MVCLNEVVPFNKITLRNNINKNIQEMIKLNFELDLKKNIMEKIQKSIKDNIFEMFGNDHFLYLNIDNNHCIHKYKRGKNDGHFCLKKIKTNLKGEDKDYRCAKHSKKHIPKKRNNSRKILKVLEVSEIPEISIHGDIYKINKNNKKTFKKKLKRNKKIFICNGGLMNFKNIFNNIL